MTMFRTKVAQEIKTHILCSVSFFLSKNHAFNEVKWKNVVQPARPQMKIWRIHISRWVPKATNTQYVLLIAFPLQQWLHERASMLRYTYAACLVKLQITKPFIVQLMHM